MNEFVEECRKEWRRLGVPDRVANEMAADLEADLEEAEAEGASAEEVLGTGALDARWFAAAWAAERGVAQSPAVGGRGLRRAPVATAIGALALLAGIGAALVLASSSGPTRLALTAPVVPPSGDRGRVVVQVLPPTGDASVAVDGEAPRVRLWTSEGEPLPLLAPPRIVAVDVDDSGVDTRIAGWVLLIVSLVGAVQLTMFWLLAGPSPRSRRRTVLG